MPNPNDVPFIWEMGASFLRDREKALKLMVDAELQNKKALQSTAATSPEALGLTKEGSQIRRSLRALRSEPYAIFAEAMDKGLLGGGTELVKLIGKAEAAQRKNWQPVPGLHGHHAASLNSVADPGVNMAPAAVVEGMQRLIDKGYHLGSRGDKFDWLSEGAHLGGHWWKGPYAHIPVDGSRKPDPKRFNIGALSNAATAVDYASAIEPLLIQQLAINREALTNPTEQKVRAAISSQAQRQGLGQVFGLEDIDLVKSNNKAFKEAGFNATTAAKNLSRYDWSNRLARPAAAGLALMPGLGMLFDAGDAAAGTAKAVNGRSRSDRGRGALQAMAGGLGLASAAAPPLIPAALAIGAVSALADRRAGLPARAAKPLYGAAKPARLVSRTPNNQLRGGVPNAAERPNTRPSVSNKTADPMAAVYRGFNKIINSIIRD